MTIHLPQRGYTYSSPRVITLGHMEIPQIPPPPLAIAAMHSKNRSRQKRKTRPPCKAT